jgi:hypothetical protein
MNGEAAGTKIAGRGMLSDNRFALADFAACNMLN